MVNFNEILLIRMLVMRCVLGGNEAKNCNERRYGCIFSVNDGTGEVLSVPLSLQTIQKIGDKGEEMYSLVATSSTDGNLAATAKVTLIRNAMSKGPPKLTCPSTIAEIVEGTVSSVFENEASLFITFLVLLFLSCCVQF